MLRVLGIALLTLVGASTAHAQTFDLITTKEAAGGNFDAWAIAPNGAVAFAAGTTFHVWTSASGVSPVYSWTPPSAGGIRWGLPARDAVTFDSNSDLYFFAEYDTDAGHWGLFKWHTAEARLEPLLQTGDPCPLDAAETIENLSQRRTTQRTGNAAVMGPDDELYFSIVCSGEGRDQFVRRNPDGTTMRVFETQTISGFDGEQLEFAPLSNELEGPTVVQPNGLLTIAGFGRCLNRFENCSVGGTTNSWTGLIEIQDGALDLVNVLFTPVEGLGPQGYSTQVRLLEANAQGDYLFVGRTRLSDTQQDAGDGVYFIPKGGPVRVLAAPTLPLVNAENNFSPETRPVVSVDINVPNPIALMDDGVAIFYVGLDGGPHLVVANTRDNRMWVFPKTTTFEDDFRGRLTGLVVLDLRNVLVTSEDSGVTYLHRLRTSGPVGAEFTLLAKSGDVVDVGGEQHTLTKFRVNPPTYVYPEAEGGNGSDGRGSGRASDGRVVLVSEDAMLLVDPNGVPSSDPPVDVVLDLVLTADGIQVIAEITLQNTEEAPALIHSVTLDTPPGAPAAEQQPEGCIVTDTFDVVCAVEDSLSSFETWTYRIPVTYDPELETFEFTASVEVGSNDIDLSNNQKTVTFNTTGADLGVSYEVARDAQDTPTRADMIVTNHGPQGSEPGELTVEIQPSDNVGFLVNAFGLPCDSEISGVDRIWTCAVPELRPGDQAKYAFGLTHRVDGLLYVRANVRSGDDPNPDNDELEETSDGFLVKVPVESDEDDKESDGCAIARARPTDAALPFLLLAGAAIGRRLRRRTS